MFGFFGLVVSHRGVRSSRAALSENLIVLGEAERDAA
jgi:hypothetical protein